MNLKLTKIFTAYIFLEIIKINWQLIRKTSVEYGKVFIQFRKVINALSSVETIQLLNFSLYKYIYIFSQHTEGNK